MEGNNYFSANFTWFLSLRLTKDSNVTELSLLKISMLTQLGKLDSNQNWFPISIDLKFDFNQISFLVFICLAKHVISKNINMKTLWRSSWKQEISCFKRFPSLEKTHKYVISLILRILSFLIVSGFLLSICRLIFSFASNKMFGLHKFALFRLKVGLFFVFISSVITAFDVDCDRLMMGQYNCTPPIVDARTQQPFNCQTNNTASINCTLIEGLRCMNSGNSNFTKSIPCSYTNGYYFETALLLSIFFGNHYIID